jgi:hypothetical protein
MRTYFKAVCFPLLLLTGSMLLIGCVTRPLSLADFDLYSERVAWEAWKEAMEAAKIVAQDGGNPILLPEGALVTFGDTFLGGRGENGVPELTGALSNSALRFRKQGDSTSVAYLMDERGFAQPIIPFEGSETFDKAGIWPSAGIHLDGTTYLYSGFVRRFGTGTWDFEAAGRGLAKAVRENLVFTRLKESPPITPHAILRGSGDTLYLYFLHGEGFQSAVYLARVAADDIEEPHAYRYWDTQAHDFKNLTPPGDPLVEGVYGQVSVVWNSYLRSYVMLHVGSLFERPREIFLRTAPRPWGPFSDPVSVWKSERIPSGEEGEVQEGLKGLFYCAYLQPHLFRNNGRVMAFTFCEIKDWAVPQLVEVTLIPHGAKP